MVRGRHGGYTPLVYAGYVHPGYMHPCTSLGTPSTRHAHDRRVYTEHAGNRVPTLVHALTELTVGDAPLTVVTELGVTVRRRYGSSRNV